MAFMMAAIGILAEVQSGGQVFACVLTVAALIAHANLATRTPIKPGQRWLLYGTLGATAVTGVLIDLIVIGVFPEYDAAANFLTRAAGATGILSGCGTLALGVVALLNLKSRRPPPRVSTELRSITLDCPACGHKQTLAIGEASCANCRLIIHTRLEEPRCPQCDYSLLMLRSDRCPECGTPVPATVAAAPAAGVA
jgi:hypothetical protein